MHLSGVKGFTMALLLLGATASWGADYLYAPKPFEGEAVGDSVVVREVTVKKGDNLSRIAKKYSGRDYYYPQILLFNDIKRPHWIQIGQVLRVPLSRKAAAGHGQQAVVEKGPERKSLVQELAVEVPKKRVEKQRPTAAAKGERNAFNRGLEAYNKGDCKTAIEQFDRFINSYPRSVLLPEATLSRADCYLKLSAN